MFGLALTIFLGVVRKTFFLYIPPDNYFCFSQTKNQKTQILQWHPVPWCPLVIEITNRGNHGYWTKMLEDLCDFCVFFFLQLGDQNRFLGPGPHCSGHVKSSRRKQWISHFSGGLEPHMLLPKTIIEIVQYLTFFRTHFHFFNRRENVLHAKSVAKQIMII